MISVTTFTTFIRQLYDCTIGLCTITVERGTYEHTDRGSYIEAQLSTVVQRFVLSFSKSGSVFYGVRFPMSQFSVYQFSCESVYRRSVFHGVTKVVSQISLGQFSCVSSL